jgi:hypothetical protein
MIPVNFLALIKPALTVLYHGQSLTKADTWKNAQALTNLGIALAAIVATFVPGVNLPSETIGSVAVAIASIANWYLTLATSKQVGLPPIELQAKPNDSTPIESVAISPTELRVPTPSVQATSTDSADVLSQHPAVLPSDFFHDSFGDK